ncbi:hypothetical protein L6452_09055 [Arctium lappa]|uniref:Uncharacterized protein n=1 Tax=Arctium lappa TaxID=4217 RepID=A0ACB9DJ68_ARCLA|nr:hypothetical protein L6452_09055 [Arctium lappa]
MTSEDLVYCSHLFRTICNISLQIRLHPISTSSYYFLQVPPQEKWDFLPKHNDKRIAYYIDMLLLICC